MSRDDRQLGSIHEMCDPVAIWRGARCPICHPVPTAVAERLTDAVDDAERAPAVGELDELRREIERTGDSINPEIPSEADWKLKNKRR